jgi:acetyltransferase-like isoleucine patch superfamily enzyme
VNLKALSHDWYPGMLPASVSIGESSWLYSAFALTHFRSERPGAVRIGRSCGVYNGSFFDLGPQGEVEVGDFSTLVGVIVATNRLVRIGQYCFLAHEVVIADDAWAWPGRTTRTRVTGSDSPAVVLEDDVWVGAGAVLLGGTWLGAGSVIGAGSVVDFCVPPNSIVGGNPARVIGQAA